MVVSVFGRHWFATGDQALEMLRISDVGGKHTPLIGAWSRWGWAHPGPLLFWLLAPFYRAFGETGVLTGAGALNLACIVAVIALAYRRAGIQLAALAGLMVALLMHGTGPVLLDPWNPWAAFFPFVVFLFLVWSVLCGDMAMLPIAVLVGSFSVQAHAGYLAMVGGLLVIAFAACIVPIVRERERHGVRRAPNARWLRMAAVAGVVVWLPAIVDQLTGGNNLRALLAYSRHPTEPAAGIHLAFVAMGAELRPNGPWITGHDIGALGFLVASPEWPGLVMFAAVLAAGLFAWRRGHHDAARLALVAIAGAVLALASTARVTGIFVPYVMRWWWGVAAIATLSIVWTVALEVRAARARAAIAAVGLLGILVTGATMVSDLPVALPETTMSRVIAAVGPPTAAALDHDNRYLVRAIDPTALGASQSGLYFDLEQRGFHVFTDLDQLSSLTHGNWRVAGPHDVDEIVMIVALPDLDAGTYVPPSGARLVATYDPLTPAQRSRYRQLASDLRARLGADVPPGRLSLSIDQLLEWQRLGTPQSMVDELVALQAHGDGYDVFVTPPAAA